MTMQTVARLLVLLTRAKIRKTNIVLDNDTVIHKSQPSALILA